MTPLAVLARSLMLGTDRGPVQLPPLAGAAADALDALAAMAGGSGQISTEERVLWAAAVLAPYEQAGRASVVVDQPFEPAPDEQHPVCSEEAAQVLRRILVDQPGLLPEWCELAEGAGVIAPPSALSGLLDAGKRSKQMRPALAGVVGRRGRWLATLNPDWKYLEERVLPGGSATETEAARLNQQAWEEGTLGERVAVLISLRRVDPASVPELLQEVWKSENAATRERLLATLEEGLTLSDEPFLEVALGDRAKRVRGLAAELLGQLPASRRARRMKARAAETFRLGRKLLRKVLEVEEPDEWDAAALADGLTEGSTSDLGRVAWRLRELTAATPLSFWTDDLGLSFEELISQVERSSWKLALSSGFMRAAKLQKNVELARALVRLSQKEKWDDEGKDAEALAAVKALLPQEELDVLAVARLAKAETLAKLSSLITRLVSGASGHWSVELSRAVHLEARKRLVRAEVTEAWRLANVLPSIAIRLHPDVLEEVSQRWPEDLAPTPKTQEEVGKFQIVLALRHHMREVFRR